MATIIVKGDLYDRLDGKLHEIKRQMRQKEGYGFDSERLDLALQAVIEGRFEAVGGQFPCLIHAADLIPKGWTVVEDVNPTLDLDISKLVPRSFLKEGEAVISGPEMRTRARELKGNWGLSDGKRMLADKGKLIRAEFHPFYIPLAGTLLRGPGGGLDIPCLDFDGGRWYLYFGWLGHDWDDCGRLACSE
ncbi:hypothetical protein A3B21_04425 [Candidatus Uhrbacteria bacterium RIFCSPLOWO2_01_FULL_47_24]|uniref:Uncharacterized protein n=1 Tax=Candidatus Uhrbacteria bacterium RIFCSPLOWO2_01_FULL_47_24 TaxID=1802401 RepID=A0A1F7UVC1_9BACT|nr:MAG: hypothetical protein A3D58_00435 [Candidatus Uhrbacteria bacterium RIFCSPHIGHO2_02_FULL_46_47]OGL74927.1 MAG: hypothetical protein A3F52_02070 [Candidatus Uhrbacteria bacterium RIFCSPHIGHO2_12_FULL_47_11]OGL81668.1 MAG: hypothetical protein A3B21_04425 [Candidatus Uhrbacteria bacterium RIFCSPLOWO2_01_FULL_47_24]